MFSSDSQLYTVFCYLGKIYIDFLNCLLLHLAFVFATRIRFSYAMSSTFIDRTVNISPTETFVGIHIYEHSRWYRVYIQSVILSTMFVLLGKKQSLLMASTSFC